jgi:predicted transcriptional regulator
MVREADTMTIRLSDHTEALLKERADRTGESADMLADMLLREALEADTGERDEAAVAAIAEGLADVDAGRTVPFEEAFRRTSARLHSSRKRAA